MNKLNPITLRPSIVDIDLDALTHNYQTLKQHVGTSKVMPIIKANAYGHGMIECVKTLEQAGADFFGVAYLEEGIELRQAGVHAPIVVLGGILGSQLCHYLDFDIDLTASSVSKLEQIEEIAAAKKKRARVHLKIDTGMERLGVHWYNAESLIERAVRVKHCEIVSIFSHFATVKSPSLDFAHTQLERFLECTALFEKHGAPTPLRHMASSGAILRLPESNLDMVRPGVTLFGIYPNPALPRTLPLKPVLSLKSRIVYFKVVKAGNGVSYNHLWTPDKDTRVVTLPIGYGDGYNLRLANKAQVLIHGKRYPIVGAMCMDQMMVDIGDDSAYNNDEVVLIGEQGNERITVEELASLMNVTPHEIVVNLNLRLPRRYHQGGESYTA